MASRFGGGDRVSTKAKLASELIVLGRVIASVRERAGLKQSDVAAALCMPGSYLSKIENGTRRLDVVELINLARALGVSASTIVDEVERKLLQSAPSP